VSTTAARTLLAEMVGPGLVEGLADDADLVLAGVDSGELIRLTLAIEERFDVEIETAC
jgi:acyl carrier protein